MSRIPSIAPAWLAPFWATTTMQRESFAFVDRGNRAAGAALLFQPVTVLSVTNSGCDVVYEEGRDYTIDSGLGRILRVPGSRIPMLPAGRASDGSLLHPWQAAISYSHRGGWADYRSAYAGEALPRTLARLRTGQPLTIAVMGDSISEGYDASGFHAFAPLQPPYARLVAIGLEQRWGGTVTLHNIAVAGSTAADGIWEAPRPAAVDADLVILAYGMNDACYAAAGAFQADIGEILRRLRGARPEVEVILVAPMLPTADCDFVEATRLPQYRDALVDLCGEGIALADLTALWTDLLRRKDGVDLSGNGLNHPNDFGHRLYAQTILAMLARDDS